VSDFIRTLNLIKTRRNSTWLTPSQQEALAELREALHMPGTVNLCGMAGVGKTFLAWTLADELGFAYFPHINRLEQGEDLQITGVILDNCRPERQVHRDTLKELRFRNVRYAVLITRQIIHDYTRYVELRLTPADQDKAWNNLTTIGIFQKRTEAPNLWYLVNPHLTDSGDFY
jgi:MoxR-like ATPase